MIRTQIQLSEQQAQRVRDLAVAEGRAMADVIRESVAAYLAATPGRRDSASLRRSAIALIGAFASKHRDLARAHDRYLAEDLAK